MNIKKTNKIGVAVVESKFKTLNNLFTKTIKNYKSKAEKINTSSFCIRTDTLSFNKDTKVIRLSKNVVKNCKLINIESIKNNIDVSDFDFNDMVILLENDESGIIKIKRTGSDFDFYYMYDLVSDSKCSFNTYSFISKDFNLDFEDNSKSVFVVQILCYLYYGDIITKYLKSKESKKINSFTKFINNSKLNIIYVDSLWRQRICIDGFKVRGHFRMQAIGENRKKRKLIWIDEFKKDGYNRKATVEL